MGNMMACLTSLLVIGEKISVWATCTALVCCLVTTMMVMLGMGIGLGYNYCFVDMTTRYRYVPAHYIYPGSPYWPFKDVRESDLAKMQPLITIPPITPGSPNLRSFNSSDFGAASEPSRQSNSNLTADYDYDYNIQSNSSELSSGYNMTTNDTIKEMSTPEDNTVLLTDTGMVIPEFQTSSDSLIVKSDTSFGAVIKEAKDIAQSMIVKSETVIASVTNDTKSNEPLVILKSDTSLGSVTNEKKSNKKPIVLKSDTNIRYVVNETKYDEKPIILKSKSKLGFVVNDTKSNDNSVILTSETFFGSVVNESKPINLKTDTLLGSVVSKTKYNKHPVIIKSKTIIGSAVNETVSNKKPMAVKSETILGSVTNESKVSSSSGSSGPVIVKSDTIVATAKNKTSNKNLFLESQTGEKTIFPQYGDPQVPLLPEYETNYDSTTFTKSEKNPDHVTIQSETNFSPVLFQSLMDEQPKRLKLKINPGPEILEPETKYQEKAPKLVIPVSDLNILKFISRLKAAGKNYTLQIASE